MGRDCLSMNHSRIARSRSHSTTWRWMAGREHRRRSGRGGKSCAGSAAGLDLLTLVPLQPNQERVREHDQNGIAMKTMPQATLIMIPAEFAFGFFMKLLDPIATMGVLNHERQIRCGGKVAPEILPVAIAACGALPNQPADMVRAIAIHAPAAYCDKLGSQPTLTAFPPGQSRPWFERSPRPVLVPVGAAAHPAPRLAANTSVSQSDRRGCVPHNDN